MRINLRAIIATTAIMAATAGTSRAADLGTRPIMPLPPAYSWTGFYIGGNMGWGFANIDATATVGGVGATASESLNGFIGGGQLGYNYQMGQTVLGIETDFQGSSQRNSNSLAVNGVLVSQTDKIPWFGTTRVRLGYSGGPWLLYATGGVAYGEGESEITLTGAMVGRATFSDTRVGWTAGVGIEFMLAGPWTGRIEYLHLDTGDVTQSTVIGGTLFSSRINVSDEIVRGAINYRF